MMKRDVVVGETYLANHTSGRVPVRILREVSRGGWGDTRRVTHWIAHNLKTGREIEIKSATKLLTKLDPRLI